MDPTDIKKRKEPAIEENPPSGQEEVSIRQAAGPTEEKW